MTAHRFEQIKRADNVGADEIAGAGDGTIDVRISGEVQDVSDVVFCNNVEDRLFIAQVDFFESVFRIFRNTFQILEMTGVGEAVKVDEPRDLGPVNDVMDEI
ncbi:MAG: hypothetical protein JWO95_1454 [Verrucomicrobiales bacterium]|nr:hypothetical protein [Verrucomicrobiales bacterium]